MSQKKLTIHYKKIILGRICCEEAPQVVQAWRRMMILNLLSCDSWCFLYSLSCDSWCGLTFFKCCPTTPYWPSILLAICALCPQTSTSSSPDSSVIQLSSIFRYSVAMASSSLLSDNCWFRQISLRINCFCCSLTLSHQFHCFLFQEFSFFSRGLFLQVGAVSTLAVLRLAIQSNRPEN